MIKFYYIKVIWQVFIHVFFHMIQIMYLLDHLIKYMFLNKMVQLVFICELPHTHNLQYLRGQAVKVAPEIRAFFPQDTPAQVADLKYLSDAYVGGRYLDKSLFPISAEQLERWSQEAELLFLLAEKVCLDRVKQGW